MPKDILTEREFELVNIIGALIDANQRDLSRHMDLSLGSINMLLRRLISKGYIRIEQLNQKKVKYILTPKGFAEKMQKSIKYTLKTLNSISLIKERLKKVVSECYNQGERNFFILGESDLAVLVETALEETPFKDYTVSRIKEIPPTKLKGILFLCKEDVDPRPHNADNCVDLINELAKNNDLLIMDRN